MAGRKPLPSAVLKQHGEKRPSRTNAAEPDFPQLIGFSPNLKGRAAEIWGETMPMLRSAGVVKVSDARALERYCQLAADLEWYRPRWIRQGLKYRGSNGDWKRNPNLTTLNEWQAEFRKLESDFGLTPSSRVRIHANPPAPEGESEEAKRKAEILAGGRNR